MDLYVVALGDIRSPDQFTSYCWVRDQMMTPPPIAPPPISVIGDRFHRDIVVPEPSPASDETQKLQKHPSCHALYGSSLGFLRNKVKPRKLFFPIPLLPLDQQRHHHKRDPNHCDHPPFPLFKPRPKIPPNPKPKFPFPPNYPKEMRPEPIITLGSDEIATVDP
ncbi:hypothetical protein COLO4_25453 [Corchorus olitorius]|uniref:Uncharacterized protein n=1 Tax=Corchorus olitorius TaxID=93759 RepID=A0A1R3I2H1_9ROSI|nr:hypothetical protein COLO4_25453 [Corchorus olitorius]